MVKPRFSTPSQAHGTSKPNVPPAQATEQAEPLPGTQNSFPGPQECPLPLLPATAQTAMIRPAPTVTSHGAMNESRDSVCMCPFVPLCVGLAACPQGACVGRCLPLLRMECCGWVPIICPFRAEQGVGAGSGGCGRGPHRKAAARTHLPSALFGSEREPLRRTLVQGKNPGHHLWTPRPQVPKVGFKTEKRQALASGSQGKKIAMSSEDSLSSKKKGGRGLGGISRVESPGFLLLHAGERWGHMRNSALAQVTTGTCPSFRVLPGAPWAG